VELMPAALAMWERCGGLWEWVEWGGWGA